MKILIEGIHQFQQNVFDTQKSLFEQLAQGQHPQALLITCSDSRVDPSLFTQTHPGDLFVMRNAGNIVPPYGAGTQGEAATIEYAVSVLKVGDIIICGHSRCGAVDALLHPEQLEQLSAVKSWLQHAEATAKNVEQKYSHLPDGQDRLTAAVEENVLVQLDNLRTHPSVVAAAARGDLTLHGWRYQFETGEVFSYDPQEQQFSPLKPFTQPAEPAS